MIDKMIFLAYNSAAQNIISKPEKITIIKIILKINNRCLIIVQKSRRMIDKPVLMNIHIFAGETPISFTFLQLLSKHFDVRDHLFVFKKSQNLQYIYPKDIGQRIIYTGNFKKFLLTFTSSFRNCRQVCFHYLPYGPSLFTWYFSPRLLQKSTWIIWGGDIYPVQEFEKKILSTIYEMLRRSIIKKIPRIAGLIREDFEIVKKTYYSKAIYSQVFYPNPINLSYLDELKKKRHISFEKSILLGNSAAFSNNHVEILTKLSPLKYDIFQIICPLSYGGDRNYVEMVAKRGNEIFGSKFVPLYDLMTPDEYSLLLCRVDIAIMNHRRQQGMGNILPLLYLEKKVFLRSDATSFNFLKNIGCTIYDTVLIEKQIDKLFSSDKKSLKQNPEIISNLISEQNCLSMWKKLLNPE